MIKPDLTPLLRRRLAGLPSISGYGAEFDLTADPIRRNRNGHCVIIPTGWRTSESSPLRSTTKVVRTFRQRIPIESLDEHSGQQVPVATADQASAGRDGKRSKAPALELWTTFPIRPLTTDSAEIRVTGQTAVVTGYQTEENAGTDKMVSMRVYANGPEGWQLVASMQYRNPT